MKKAGWPTMIVLVALLGGVGWHASLRVSTGSAEGTSIEGEAASPDNGHRLPNNVAENGRSTIRLGSFNIHGGKGADGRRNLQRIAECLDDLDFVALQEVRGQTAFGATDQAEQLGLKLDMQWLFAPAERRWYCLEFGNGLLARVPVVFWRRIPLPRQFDRGYRNMVLAELECRTAANSPCTIRLLLSHVNRRYDAERQSQLRCVIAMYLSLAEPAVLLGDLNSTAADPQIRALLQTPGVRDAVAEKLGPNAPSARIDWIIVRGLRCAAAGIRDDGASDHPLVWAELELP